MTVTRFSWVLLWLTTLWVVLWGSVTFANVAGGVVVATAKFDDEVRELRERGIDTAFNLYTEAGTGFAHHVSKVFHQQRPDLDGRLRRHDAEES